MTDVLTVVVLAVGAVVVAGLVWWLLIESEGVYLGRRVVIWLYDLYADRYDDIKHFRREYDHMFLAQPIMERVAPQRAPLVLDVGTGTARLPLALIHHAHFQGRVVALDLSRRMLHKASLKLAGEGRVALLHAPAERLTFPADTFDVVACLEALEFLENQQAVLRELVRVLRPGGLLLVTNRLTRRWMPGKTQSSEALCALLHDLGMVELEMHPWQVDYERIWGVKAGDGAPGGARPLAEFFVCPRCRENLLVETDEGWACPLGHYRASVGADGVIEMV